MDTNSLNLSVENEKMKAKISNLEQIIYTA